MKLVKTKHRKTDCAFFAEGGLPCEDCDLEGHNALCGWHQDWHTCTCGAHDSRRLVSTIKVIDVVDQEDGSSLVSFDLGDDFISWFCEHKNLEKFDKDVFQEWFIETLQAHLANLKIETKEERE